MLMLRRLARTRPGRGSGRGGPPRVVSAVVVSALCCVAACSSTATPRPAGESHSSGVAAAQHQHPWSVVALGDSVPTGANCGCTPFPDLTAAEFAARAGTRVSIDNDAVNGFTTQNVVAQLSSDRTVISQVRSATAVEVEIGANDVGYSQTCGTDAACYATEVPALRANLNRIVARLEQLSSGRRLLVVLVDYWNVWLGGTYAAEKGGAYVAAGEQVTDDVNTVIRTVAREHRLLYVDTRAAFKGPDYASDETRYLSDDGDHPNALGQQRIANAVVQVVTTSDGLPTGR